MPKATNKLQGRKVFLDTSVFVTSRYHVERPDFVALADLAANGRVQVLTTAITKHELAEHVREDLNKAYVARKALRKEGSILNNLDGYSALFAEGQFARDLAELQSKTDAYILRLQAQEVPVLGVSVETLVATYVQRAPPFGSGGKRHEFKDAIVLLALENYSDEGDSLYVISNDNDMKDFCESSRRLIYLPNIAAFADLVMRQDDALAQRALTALQRHQGAIIDQTEKLFRDMSFFVADYDDEEVELTDVSVGEPDEPELLEIEDTNARFQFFTTISFSATVDAEDPNTGFYDKEEGVAYFMERVHRTVEDDIEVTVTGQIVYGSRPTDDRIICDAIYNERTHESSVVLQIDEDDER
jgi:predicted nucleic acid-binding protein